MTRYEPRDFYNPDFDVVEPRVVDLDAKSVLVPAGSIMMCANGHVAAQVVNSIDANQVMDARDFAPLQLRMAFREEQEYPRCNCGAHLFRDDYGCVRANIQGRGWVPEYDEGVMLTFADGWDAPERPSIGDALSDLCRSIAEAARVIAGIRETWGAA